MSIPSFGISVPTLVAQFSQQFVLNHAPALYDRFVSSSIHLRILQGWFQSHVIPEMAATHLLTLPRSIKIKISRLAAEDLQEAQLNNIFQTFTKQD